MLQVTVDILVILFCFAVITALIVSTVLDLRIARAVRAQQRADEKYAAFVGTMQRLLETNGQEIK